MSEEYYREQLRQMEERWLLVQESRDELRKENEKLHKLLNECDGRLSKRPCTYNRCIEYVKLRSALERIAPVPRKLLRREPVICLDEILAEVDNVLKMGEQK